MKNCGQLKFFAVNLFNSLFAKLRRKKKKNLNPLYQNIADELNLGKVLSVEVIQSLWGGYGELVRLMFKDISIIVKHIKLPKPSEHPRGWNTDFSHQRKLHSYQVEVNWYENFSKTIDENCRIPKGLKCFQDEEEFLIVMEDLATAGFENTTSFASKESLKACLSWLANFHAKYMNTQSDLLWEVGTYWHLDTRPDELEVLDDYELKSFAKKIDGVLKNTKYQTIVHGDAKLANFCFSSDGRSCAAVDFQYIGHGCGMKDVAYFISSAVSPDECKQMQTWLLDTYFEALNDALKHYQPKLDSNEIEEEWRKMFTIAWADFQRFVKGWSPSHFKINSYTEEITAKALRYLKSSL